MKLGTSESHNDGRPVELNDVYEGWPYQKNPSTVRVGAIDERLLGADASPGDLLNRALSSSQASPP